MHNKPFKEGCWELTKRNVKTFNVGWIKAIIHSFLASSTQTYKRKKLPNPKHQHDVSVTVLLTICYFKTRCFWDYMRYRAAVGVQGTYKCMASISYISLYCWN